MDALGSYKANPDFFRKLALSPQIRDALRGEAERGKIIAEGLAEDFRITGEYASSFEVTDLTLLHWEGRYKGPRGAARLVNTAGYAAAVEWGKGGRSGDETQSNHRVLGRTLDALRTEG
jgi:hypothetical protein